VEAPPSSALEVAELLPLALEAPDSLVLEPELSLLEMVLLLVLLLVEDSPLEAPESSLPTEEPSLDQELDLAPP
jgi:hypothetical protein